jgi:hypothetical protein
MPNPWVSPRHDQLILVNKAVNEPLEKGDTGGGKKYFQMYVGHTYT